MPTPSEHKTVQARFLEYAEAISWTVVSRGEAEQRRGFDSNPHTADRARNSSLFSDDLLDATVQEFNPRFAEAKGALLGQFSHLHTDIYGSREFIEYLGYLCKFIRHENRQVCDLMPTLFCTLIHIGMAAKIVVANVHLKKILIVEANEPHPHC